MGNGPHDAQTLEMDRLKIILELLQKREKQQDQSDQNIAKLSTKIDAARAEGHVRGVEQHAFNQRIDVEVRAVRHEVRNVSHRLLMAEAEIVDLRAETGKMPSADLEAIRSAIRKQEEEAAKSPSADPSHNDLEREAIIGQTVAQVINLESGVTEVKLALDEQDKKSANRNEVQERFNRAAASALGIDYVALTAPQPLDPVDAKVAEEKAKPKTNIAKIGAENRVAAVLALLTFLTALLQLLAKYSH